MSDHYVGEIRMFAGFAGQRTPAGWKFCDGATLQIKDYELLYALIGTSYGGDGRTTFNLPDLRGRVPIHTGIQPVENINYPLASAGGTETVTLLGTQLPLHTHSVNVVSGAGKATIDSPANAFPATGTIESYDAYNASAQNKAMNTGSVSAVGGNLPHDNMQPFLTIGFMIAVSGTYPSPN
ncbi:phage tail protein [Paenibacillus campi]|uniref:phage tail protein n=1 Tax=Paenibacillus campi TaxID=3106031 RepID=UPI002AFE319D|nr:MULTISPECIES: tail fiber protein [unclassified Paenibacillus]